MRSGCEATNDAMNADERNGGEQSGHGANSWTLAALGLVVFYLLSPPPLAWMYKTLGHPTPHWPRIVYMPIILLYNQSEVVRSFYDSYADVLGVKL